MQEDIILQPDVLVVCQPFEKENTLEKTPSVIFEILSPSSVEKDRKLKYAIYEAAGVNYYIILNPVRKTVEVFILEEGKYSLLMEISSANADLDTEKCRIPFDFSRIW